MERMVDDLNNYYFKSLVIDSQKCEEEFEELMDAIV